MPAEARRAARSGAAPRQARIPSDRWRAGARIGNGRYRLERRLHSGSLTSVWAAQNAAGDRVAVKALRAELAGRPAAREWLRREHAWLAGLDHPHVVRALELIDTRDAIAIVTEYLGGGDLVSLAGGDPAIWLPAARDLVATLDDLHGRGIVHRDVKSRNVMFDAADRIRLIDFGSAAAIGAPATAAGTTAAHRRASRATEQESPAADWQAAAVVLHELCHGCLPAGPAAADGGDVDPRLAPLAGLVAATLSARPDAEPESAGPLLAAIEFALSAPPKSRPTRASSGRANHPTVPTSNRAR